MNNYLLIDDLNKLKKEILNEKKFLLNKLLKQVEYYKKINLPLEHPKCSITYMGIGIFNISLAYILTNDNNYLKEANRWIDTVCIYETWGHNHLVNVDLSASWVLFGLSISYNYLKNYLDKKQQLKIKYKIIKHANILYNYYLDNFGNGWPTNYFQNHNWINMTGLATAGYALKQECEDSKLWINLSKDNFQNVYPYLSNDGSDYEGIVYWHYGIMWLLVYADILRQEENIDYYQESSFLKNTFDYRISQLCSDLKNNCNFGDCHDYRSGHSCAIYYKLAKEYNNGYAQYLGNFVHNYIYDEEQNLSHLKPGLKNEIGFDLLWYNPLIQEQNLKSYPRELWFYDLGLFSKRESWENDSSFFSIKCGFPGGKGQYFRLFDLLIKENINSFSLGHHHPDNNHFIVYKDNEYYAIDDGYNRNCFSNNHNIVTVDNYGYDVENCNDVWTNSIKKRKEKYFDIGNYGGFVPIYKTIDNISFYIGRTEDVYKLETRLKLYKRLVIIPNFDYILIFDSLDSKLEHNYKWNFHSDVEPIFFENGFKINKRHCLNVYNILPKEKQYEIDEQKIETCYTTQEPDNLYKLNMINTKIISKKTKAIDFLNILSFDNLIYQEEDYGLRINYKNRNDLFIYKKNNIYETDSNFIFYSNKKNKYYIYKGSYLKINNKEVDNIEIL